MQDFISELDSARFGINVAKINDFDQEPVDTINRMKQNDVKLIISKIPLENIAIINKLEKLGFELKDVQVTYKFDLSRQSLPEINRPDSVLIREANIEDIETLQLIARESFYNYGHYTRNEHLDKDTCADIYSDWIRNSCINTDFADLVLVAEVDHNIAGFLSFKIKQRDKSTYTAGGIGAVSSLYRNNSVFLHLSQQGLLWAKNKNLDWVEHNVLVDNYPVNKSFVKSGFHIFKSMVTMHLWIS